MSSTIAIHVIDHNHFNEWLTAASAVSRSWLSSTQFKGKSGQYAVIPGADGEIDCVVFSVDPADPWSLGTIGKSLPAGSYALEIHPWSEADLQQAVLAWHLGQYQFTRYKKSDTTFGTLELPAGCDAAQLQQQIDAIHLARDLVNTPADDLNPQTFAQVVTDVVTARGAECQSIVGDDLKAGSFGGIHGVGRAAEYAPRLMDVTWGDPAHPAVTIIGKGVCFDTGGLDIKPASGMREMKKDMGGAASALALSQWIMDAKLPIRLRLLLPLVENAVAGNSMRPGDVLTMKSGKTVEIGHTDAEGRLILADALAYAMEDKPDYVIDFATLTGASRIALGPDLPSYFCSDESFAQSLEDAAAAMHDPIWRLPLYAPYKKLLKSDVADLCNIASIVYGGAITAALFLQEFVAKDVPWLHVDMMGANTRDLPGRPKGGETGPIRAVFHWLQTL